MNKRPAQTAQTIANICEAFWKCCEIKGTYNVTVKSVISIAGYNHSTFYEYFENITFLRKYAEEQILSGINELIQQAICESVSDDTLENMLNQIIDQYGRYLKIIFKMSDINILEQLEKVFRPLVEAGIPEGNFAPEDIELVCTFTTGDMLTVLLHYTDGDSEYRKKLIHSMHIWNRNGAPGLLRQDIPN